MLIRKMSLFRFAACNSFPLSLSIGRFFPKLVLRPSRATLYVCASAYSCMCEEPLASVCLNGHFFVYASEIFVVLIRINRIFFSCVSN